MDRGTSGTASPQLRGESGPRAAPQHPPDTCVPGQRALRVRAPACVQTREGVRLGAQDSKLLQIQTGRRLQNPLPGASARLPAPLPPHTQTRRPGIFKSLKWVISARRLSWTL